VISAHAKDSIERILFKAAKSRLIVDGSDHCEIVPAGAHGAPQMPGGSNARLVVLTISGIAFRLLLILHFEEDEQTHQYFVKEESELSFIEVFFEICNLCCGSVNQELLNYFPDLGMSTPYVLNAQCMPYLEALKPGMLSSYAITINGTVNLGATICVCAHAPIDFVADVSVVEDSGGELELF
jgi:hypothetical protein